MMKKRLIPIVVLALVVVMSIGIAAIQLGRNSQTIGSYTISGYLEYVTSDGIIQAETVASEKLSATGINYIYARIVGYPRVEKSVPAYEGHKRLSFLCFFLKKFVNLYGSMGGHGGTLANGAEFDFNTIDN